MVSRRIKPVISREAIRFALSKPRPADNLSYGSTLIVLAMSFVFIIVALIYIVPTYYDFQTITGSENTIGEFEIDEENLEEVQDNVSEFVEVVAEPFNFEPILTGFVLLIGLWIVSMLIFKGTLVFFKTQR